MKKIKHISLLFVFLAVILSSVPVSAQLHFTQEEQDYIDTAGVIQAVSLHGSAPLQYAGKKGEIKGISIEVLEKISEITGLVFEYHLIESIDEAYDTPIDLIFGIPASYVPENMVLSRPFLESQTILYLNSSVDPEDLSEKIYAGTLGSTQPEGIPEEYTVNYKTREDSLNAVEAGHADYGYGNAYSVAFYTLQNGYQNIITVPRGKDDRAYCFAVPSENEVLLSILNKSIGSIDERELQTLVLISTAKIDRKITLSMIVSNYGLQLILLSALIITVLSVSIFRNLRDNKELKIQNERYQILSNISNEYMYEYYFEQNELNLSKSIIHLFESREFMEESVVILKEALRDSDSLQSIYRIELPLSAEKKKIFKSVSSLIRNSKGKVYSVIGKLIDVSEEEAERQELIKKSETDGLTGLYNAETTKKLINEIMEKNDPHKTDALLILDCDKFKEINDSHGHLHGDSVIVHIGEALKSTFRKSDIIGRIGGDEFCVYMENVSSRKFIISKYHQLVKSLKQVSPDSYITVSVGAALSDREKSYDDLFKKADAALYIVKDKGGDNLHFYDKKTM